MTLCIAAVTRWYGSPEKAFILCSDGRLGGGAWGSDDKATKLHCLGYNFYGLMAGHWDTVRSLGEHVERDLMAGGLPRDLGSLADTLKKSADRFSSSSEILCPPGKLCELIVTGFISGSPVMLNMGVDDRQASVSVRHDVDVVGDGAFAAQLILKHRGYDPLTTEFHAACYCIYEAKKFSESIDSVGPATRMRFHLSVDCPAKDQYGYYDLSPLGIECLEAQRNKLFLQHLAVERLTPLCFDPSIVVTRGSPKPDQPLQPPLPESPK